MRCRQRAGTLTYDANRAVDPVAESFPVRTEVVAPVPAEQAFAADLGGGLGDDAIAFVKRLHGPPRLRDGAGELVAENHRHVDGPGVRVVRLMHVGAADRYGADAEQHITVPISGTATSRSSTASGSSA